MRGLSSICGIGLPEEVGRPVEELGEIRMPK